MTLPLVIPGFNRESRKSWVPDQVEDDAGVSGMTLPLVIPGYDRESRKSWIPDQVEDDAGVSG